MHTIVLALFGTVMTQVLICRVKILHWVIDFIEIFKFPHTLHCFSLSLVAITLLPQCQWSNPEEYGWMVPIDPSWNITKSTKCTTIHIHVLRDILCMIWYCILQNNQSRTWLRLWIPCHWHRNIQINNMTIDINKNFWHVRIPTWMSYQSLSRFLCNISRSNSVLSASAAVLVTHSCCSCASCDAQLTDLPQGGERPLTHWGRDKIAAISQTTFSNAFYWMKMYEFWFRFHRNLFPRV